MEEEDIQVKKSRLRQEIEAMLEKRDIIYENRISVSNLEGEETYHFDNRGHGVPKGQEGQMVYYCSWFEVSEK
jgi:hypothetical protein